MDIYPENNIFYTYLLLDPRNFYLPFYVGKGKNKRAESHLKETNINKTDNEIKFRIIQNIRKTNQEPIIFYWNKNLSEIESLKLEKELILKFGRINMGTGILSNLTDGGDSNKGYKMTNEIKEKINHTFFKPGHIPDILGKNYIGKFQTPHGTFNTLVEVNTFYSAFVGLCVSKYCKNNNKIITRPMTSRSKILKKEWIGKTLEEIGFKFIPHKKEIINKLNKPKPSKLGKVNLKGIWITPYGNFNSYGEASKFFEYDCHHSLNIYCKSNLIITKDMCTHSKILKREWIHKSFKDVGFDYIDL